MTKEKVGDQKPDLPVDPKRGDEIMRRAFQMPPKPKKAIRGKKKASKNKGLQK